MNSQPTSSFTLNSSNAYIKQTAATLTAIIVAQGMAHEAKANAYDDMVADQTATQLDAVNVQDQKAKPLSSPKFTQPLINTPQSIYVIPSGIYSAQAATSLSDVLRNTPGITFAAGEGGSAASTGGDSLYLRGTSATNKIFIDGVRDNGAYTRDVFNIDQVEVSKGPAGSDVGRGAASGYINIVTKAPTLVDAVSSTLSYGFDEEHSKDRKRATIDINEALDNTKIKGVAFRVNGLWQDGGVAGRKVAELNRYGVAPSLALGLGTATRVYLYYQYLNENGVPDYGLPLPAFPGYATTPATPYIAPNAFYGNVKDINDVENNTYTARIEHDFTPNVKVSNQTRFAKTERTAITTLFSSTGSYVPATGLLTRVRAGNHRESEIFSNLTNANVDFTTGVLEHTFSAGLEITQEKNYLPTYTSATLAAIPIINPDPTSVVASPVLSGASTRTKIKTFAPYVFDSVKLSDKWIVSAGLRYDDYQTDYSSVPAPATPPVAPTSLTAEHGILSWKTGLVYKPAANGSIYFAYGTSKTPPGDDFSLSAPTTTLNQNNPNTDPQTTESYELGTKWDFLKNRLSTTAALFSTKNSNTVYTDAITGLVYNSGEQTVKGVEVSVSGTVTENWLVYGGVAYMKTEISQGTLRSGNLQGTALPLAPEWTGNLWTTYRLPFGITLGGGGQYVDETKRLEQTGIAPLTLPGYTLWNGMASYEVNKHLSVRFNASNIFDKNYVQSISNNGGRLMWGAPRSYVISADIKF